MKENKGFTLIELMIAVAIIGILAAVAYPAYQNSIIKGNRAAAKTFLMEVSQKEAQYLLDKRAYTTSLDDLGLTSSTIPLEFSRHYTAAIVVTGPPPGYTIRATPIAGKQQAKDGWLELSHTGVKTSQYPDKW